MNRSTMGLVALLGAAALLAGCSDDDDDDDDGGLPALSGPQTGNVNVNLATSAVTFPTQPQGVKLSGSAVYDDPGDTVTLSLTLRNATTTLLQNTKVIPTNLSEGTITGDGTFVGPQPPGDGGGDPYIYYGPEAMLSNAQVTREITIDGITGAVPDISMDVEILMHPSFVLSSDFNQVAVVDSSGSGQSVEIDVSALGFFGTLDTVFQPYLSSADGRYVHLGCWNQPAVGRLDLSDLSVSIGSSLAALPIAFDGSGAVGSVDSLTLSPDGNYIYAVLNDGCHSFRRGTNELYPPPSVEVVKLNTDLAEVDSVLVLASTVIPTSADGGIPTFVYYRGRKVSVSDDGTRGAMAVTGIGTVFLLDLGSMTVIDVDDVTPDTQGFDLSGTSMDVRHAALSGDASTIYVAYNDAGDGTLDVIDVATGGITPKAPPTLGGGFNAAAFLEFGPDGRLYYGRDFDLTVPGVSIYEPGTDTWTELADIISPSSVHFGAASYCVVDASDDSIRCFSYADDSAVLAPASGLAAVGAPVRLTSHHGLVLTD